MRNKSPETPERQSNPRSRLKKMLGGLAVASTFLTIMSVPSSNAQEFVKEPPSINILHDDNVCPPDAETALINASGVGMNTVSEYAGKTSKEILGDERPICFASLYYGNTHDPEGNLAAFSKFKDDHGFSSFILFGHSYGGISLVNMLNDYKQNNPEDNTKYTVALFATPGGEESLPLHIKLGAMVQSKIPISEEAMYFLTFMSILSQRNEDLSYHQHVQYALENSAATPPRLVQGQSTELLTHGMQPINPGIDATFIYVADKNDGIVDTNRAPEDIERRLGKLMSKVIMISHDDDRLDSHAALWWAKYIGNYTPAVKEIVDLAEQELAA